MKKALLLHAPGTNRDADLATALRAAGGEPEIIPLSRLHEHSNWQKYHLLALPGGFSYGDALGAGRLWALDLQTRFRDLIHAFVASGRPVIGICNGFQALVKAGILPGEPQNLQATLTFNASGHFECRWVTLRANPNNSSAWLRDLPEIYCPVAHGEGRFLVTEGSSLPNEQIALQYHLQDGTPANGLYPFNPNGSPNDIAGITNLAGNVLGLMPHPENHIHPYQHPQWTRSAHPKGNGLGLTLFENALKRF